MAQMLDRNALKRINNDIRGHIQREKVFASKGAISKLQNKDKFPPNKDIVSYVTSLNPKNRYNSVTRFWAQMSISPKYWDKKFIHINAGQTADNKQISEAARMAVNLVYTQTLKYPRYDSRYYVPTYRLSSNLQSYVNGSITQNAVRSIEQSDGPAVFQITNLADYASSAEAHAMFYYKMGGIIFWAAQKVQRKYPGLGVLFNYSRPEEFGASHKYDLPVLTIGPKDLVGTRWSRPGRREKARRRLKARLRRATGG